MRSFQKMKILGAGCSVITITYSIQPGEYSMGGVLDGILYNSSPMRCRIKDAIEQKLIEHPEIFGKPLRRSLKNYRKLRIGDYRIIFRIEGENVKILIIAHRSFVYEKVLRRSDIS